MLHWTRTIGLGRGQVQWVKPERTPAEGGLIKKIFPCLSLNLNILEERSNSPASAAASLIFDLLPLMPPDLCCLQSFLRSFFSPRSLFSWQQFESATIIQRDFQTILSAERPSDPKDGRARGCTCACCRWIRCCNRAEESTEERYY